jgi:gas vesicle structural protein
MRDSGCGPLLPQSTELVMKDAEFDDTEHVTLCEALDRVLNKGAVVVGEVTISVANVDLIYLGLQLVLTSIDTSETMKASSCNHDWNRTAAHREGQDILG